MKEPHPELVGKMVRFWDDDPECYHHLEYIGTNINGQYVCWDSERLGTTYYDNMSPIPEKKKVAWSREDYGAEPRMLRNKNSGADCLIMRCDHSHINIEGFSVTYKYAAQYYTLPDGTELYKEIEE